jgi:RNA polymerase sigma-70 factor (ECF subfamily)
MKTEKNLFELIKKSDEKAYEILFRLYYEPLVKYCNQYLDDKDLAKGFTQQVFVNIWEKRHTLQIQQPAPFLYKSVKNKCLNHFRHQEVKLNFQKSKELHEISYEQVVDEPNDHIIQIYNSIDKLSPQCKRIFIMSRIDGLTHKEIAEELDLASKTVKNQIGKALKHLKEDLSHLNIGLIICIIRLFL